jgi:hypothetical protein
MKEKCSFGSSLYHDDFNGDYYSQTGLERETLIEEDVMPRCEKGKVKEKCITEGCLELHICRAKNGFDESVPKDVQDATFPPCAKYDGRPDGGGCCCD